MCDVCQSEELDWRIRNGANSKLCGARLYRVYQGREARTQLCYLHSIELFMIGERRFLRNHLRFARILAERAHEYKEKDDYNFGAL